MKNQDLENETYVGEDGLLYCAKCHTPCEKVLLIIPGCQPTKSAVQLSLTTLQPI